MNAGARRARRVLRGLLMNSTQSEFANAEKITQSAVSQTLHNSGAIALLASEALLTELSVTLSA